MALGHLFSHRRLRTGPLEVPGVNDVLGTPVRGKRNSTGGSPAWAYALILPKQRGSKAKSEEQANCYG